MTMEVIDNIIFNALLRHREIRLPRIGVLRVVAVPAQPGQTAGQAAPPQYKTEFIPGDDERVLSVIDYAATRYETNVENVDKLYWEWFGNATADGAFSELEIGNVGMVINSDGVYNVVMTDRFDRLINPLTKIWEQAPVAERSKTRVWNVVLTVVILVIIGGGVWFYFKEPYKEAPRPTPPAKTETPAPPVVECPEPSVSATIAVADQAYHIIAGMYSVEANADKAIVALRGENLSGRKIPYGSRFLVSIGSYPTKEEAQQSMNALARTYSEGDQLWIYSKP